MDLVFDDRSTKGAASLLIGIRQHSVGDWIRCVELVAADVPIANAGQIVGAGLRDSLHLYACRPALRDVEQVRDDLELGDRLAAEMRLPGPGADVVLFDLLAVQVQLKTLVVC